MNNTFTFSRKEAFTTVKAYANSHYENFPVISFLIPNKYQDYIAAIYYFARIADDFADEGNCTDEERIANLDLLSQSFNRIAAGNCESNEEYALYLTLRENNIDISYLFDLISAFKQDIIIKRYKTFEDILDYSNRSANPIGRILLRIFKTNNSVTDKLSDDICTALQLINFYQDVSIDSKINRIYIPLDELDCFGITENVLLQQINSEQSAALIKHQIKRAKEMLLNGANLISYLDGRFKLEIASTVLGGLEIIKKIENANYKVLSYRPVLSKFDYLGLLLRSVIYARRFSKKNIEEE